MVKGWVGAAGRGVVGAAPLFEADLLVGNWSYPKEPTTTPLLDAGDLTRNFPISKDRGVANWSYPKEPTTTPLLDQGPLTRNLPVSKAQGHDTEPYNAIVRGLEVRVDAKIKKPWLWP
ncbi:hypothetical protein LCGC14_0565790 [marine sediment metagenome]|uniref:Uncharacterized protein n=1 Tax=marine sediment metagenome TaxID=412755 RepID=A0A0F9S4B4_9ZZZZ